VSWASHPKGEVPEGYYTVPLGTADVALEGDELTIITYGTLVHVAIAAARETGVDAEVIDVRTMAPLDVKTLADSVKKTGRCMIAHEATRFGGYGAELAATIQKDCFYHLEAPIGRVAGWDTPYPHAFEWQYFPGLRRMSAGIRRVMEAE
jgi:2-oxoisovalerate dehydrogenase E1 component beta subunit